jgi:hypothetical protein
MYGGARATPSSMSYDSTSSLLFWFIISPLGTPVHQKICFHYNKQQWTTQQLPYAPTLCTATRTSELTATTKHHNGTGIHGPANQQQQEGEAEARGGESGAAATANNNQHQLHQLQTRCNGTHTLIVPALFTRLSPHHGRSVQYFITGGSGRRRCVSTVD